LCLVHFTLIRFTIDITSKADKKKGLTECKDVFTAEIVRIAMQVTGTAGTPKKRTRVGNASQFAYTSPSKKKKID